jgi:hypothetical protein
MSRRKVLLLEPNYKNKYPPMGLMKIATYHRCRNDDVRFFKGDLKDLAAGLLVEEFLEGIDMESSLDKALHEFVVKRGASAIFEYIKTGKHAPLKRLEAFSGLLAEDAALKRLSSYRNRYRAEDYPKFDRICVTTLFTFYWKETIETIIFAKKLCDPNGSVYVGGIASSLVPEHIEKETGIKPHIGLLNQPYLYDNDEEGNVVIDDLPLDYSILEEIDYSYPVADSYFGYMTRGCVNRCAFCAVPKLEPYYCGYIGIKTKIQKVEECFGPRRNLLLMDNNVFASECFDAIIDEIKDCGFGKGATYIPPNEYAIAYRNLIQGFHLSETSDANVFNFRAYARKLVGIYDAITLRLAAGEKGAFYNKREELGLLFPETVTKESVEEFHALAGPLFDKHFKRLGRIRIIDFNQGLDGRLASDEKMSKISEIAIRPLRIAFDHWAMRDAYEKAVVAATAHGIKDLSNYLLYNFNDHPDDLYKRMRLNIDLCEKLGVTIYSFPMKYHPIDDPEYFRNRDYIGKPHWNRKFIRSVQAVLNSTHGKIGKGLTFFEAAFGKDLDEFHKILWMPEALIIQRYKYDKQMRLVYYGDEPTPYDDLDDATGNTTADWWNQFTALDECQRAVAGKAIIEQSFADSDIDAIEDEQVRSVLKFYQIRRDEK